MVSSITPSINETFVNSLKDSQIFVDDDLGTINIHDWREIKRALSFLKKQELFVRKVPLKKYSLKSNNILQISMLKSFMSSYSRYTINNKYLPYLDTESLENIASKLYFVIDHLDNNATLLTHEKNSDKLKKVSLADFCEAICNCVFYSVEWSEKEVLYIIRNLLESQCFGNIGLYRTKRFIDVIRINKLHNQPFSSPIGVKNRSWLKYVKFLVVGRKHGRKKSINLHDKAKKHIKDRHPVKSGIIVSLYNYLGLTAKDRLFLHEEPSIFESAFAESKESCSQISCGNVIFTLKLIMDTIRYNNVSEISLARGLLSFFFPLTSLSNLEK